MRLAAKSFEWKTCVHNENTFAVVLAFERIIRYPVSTVVCVNVIGLAENACSVNGYTD